MRLFKAFRIFLALGPASICAAEKLVPETPVKVAFLGDQGLGPNSVAVLKLVKSEKVDLVLHQGDFDYDSDPKAWDAQITSVLGDSFPYLASIGNHDTNALAGYQEVLDRRLSRT